MALRKVLVGILILFTWNVATAQDEVTSHTFTVEELNSKHYERLYQDRIQQSTLTVDSTNPDNYLPPSSTFEITVPPVTQNMEHGSYLPEGDRWKFTHSGNGLRTFEVLESNNSVALGIQVANSNPNQTHSSYWYRGFDVVVPANSVANQTHSFAATMKVDSSNVPAGLNANFSVAYQKADGSWGSLGISNLPVGNVWTHQKVFDLPSAIEEQTVRVRIFPRLQGYGSGSAVFDNLTLRRCIATSCNYIGSSNFDAQTQQTDDMGDTDGTGQPVIPSVELWSVQAGNQQQFNGWKYAKSGNGLPTVEITDTSYSNTFTYYPDEYSNDEAKKKESAKTGITYGNNALKLTITPENGVYESAYWFKEISPISVVDVNDKYVFRMKIKDQRDNSDLGQDFSAFIRIQQDTGSGWTTLKDSSVTVDSEISRSPNWDENTASVWTDTITTLSFSDIGDRDIRVLAILSGTEAGSVMFDDLEVFREVVSTTDNECELQPKFGTPKTQKSALASEIQGLISNGCEDISFDNDYLIETEAYPENLNDSHIYPSMVLDFDEEMSASNGVHHFEGGGVLTLAPRVYPGDNLGAPESAVRDTDYRTIFSFFGYAENVSFTDITFDHNSQNRLLRNYDGVESLKNFLTAKKIYDCFSVTSCDETQYDITEQQAEEDYNRTKNSRAGTRNTIAADFNSRGYGEIKFENLKVWNSDSTVSLYVPRSVIPTNETNAGDLFPGEKVTLNRISVINATNHGLDYDSSYINVDTEQGRLTNSYFSGENWENAPRTAMEIHFQGNVDDNLGSEAIENNLVERFQIGMNFSGISKGGVTADLVATDNILHTSRNGILIWSQRLDPTVAETDYADYIALDNSTIDDNEVYLYPDLYKFFDGPQIFRVGSGIGFYAGRDFTHVRNLRITRNHIEYMHQNDDFFTETMVRYTGGISAFNLPGEKSVDGLTIVGNTIRNCAGPGIYFANHIRNPNSLLKELDISNNIFTECGNFSNTNRPSWYPKNHIIYVNHNVEGSVMVDGNVFNYPSVNPLAHDIEISTSFGGDAVICEKIGGQPDLADCQ